jgi:hypothetical protein
LSIELFLNPQNLGLFFLVLPICFFLLDDLHTLLVAIVEGLLDRLEFILEEGGDGIGGYLESIEIVL